LKIKSGLTVQILNFELYGKKVPKAVENFISLCTGEKGISKSGAKLHYKGTEFSDLIPQIKA